MAIIVTAFRWSLGQSYGEDVMLSSETRKLRLDKVSKASSQVRSTSECWRGSHTPGFRPWALRGPCKQLPSSRWPRRRGHTSIRYILIALQTPQRWGGGPGWCGREEARLQSFPREELRLGSLRGLPAAVISVPMHLSPSSPFAVGPNL